MPTEVTKPKSRNTHFKEAVRTQKPLRAPNPNRPACSLMKLGVQSRRRSRCSQFCLSYSLLSNLLISRLSRSNQPANHGVAVKLGIFTSLCCCDLSSQSKIAATLLPSAHLQWVRHHHRAPLQGFPILFIIPLKIQWSIWTIMDEAESPKTLMHPQFIQKISLLIEMRDEPCFTFWNSDTN